MEDNQLKACPLCRSSETYAQADEPDSQETYCQVGCAACEVHIHHIGDLDTIVKRWNTRPQANTEAEDFMQPGNYPIKVHAAQETGAAGVNTEADEEIDLFDYHACLTGDCDHKTQAECDAAFDKYVGDIWDNKEPLDPKSPSGRAVAIFKKEFEKRLALFPPKIDKLQADNRLKIATDALQYLFNTNLSEMTSRNLPHEWSKGSGMWVAEQALSQIQQENSNGI